MSTATCQRVTATDASDRSASAAVMNDSAKPTIVVGVSGSPASARALRWAADAAVRLDAQLKVVLIWSIEQRAFYAPAISPDDYSRRQERAVCGLTATVRAELGPIALDSVTTEVAQGMPERALVEQSAGADLLVLGSASATVTARSIGSVIRACLSHAHCPVVVVGPEGARSDRGHGGEIRQQLSGMARDRRDLQRAGQRK
jgi:nucleotide-binding universal stress UspA family protein